MQNNLHVPSYANPSKWQKFLWWLAAADVKMVAECNVDRNKFSITGLMVLCTTIFATCSWLLFFSTVISSLPIIILSGILMGFIVLCIDRSLIAGITISNKNKILSFITRLLLACIISSFMTQPVLLFLFKKEINMQISIDNEQKKLTKLQQQKASYAPLQNELEKEKNTLTNQLKNKYIELADARKNFITETDGTGGSKKIGLSNIAKVKQQTYEKILGDYTALENANNPSIKLIDSQLNTIHQKIMEEQEAFESLLHNGFLIQIDALNNLIKHSKALQIRYYILLLLFLLIELMPVIAKLLLPTEVYHKKLAAVKQKEIEKIDLFIKFNETVHQQWHEKNLAYTQKSIDTFFNTADEDIEQIIVNSNTKFETKQAAWNNIHAITQLKELH